MNPVVIVGAGPAGSACAWRLASSGTRCLLLDKAVFPREKVCGGALSPHGASLLVSKGMVSESELDTLSHATHRRMSFWDGSRRLSIHESYGEPVRLVRRSTFDSFLLERAASAGAEVLTGVDVLSADPETHFTTAEGERSFKWSSLVCADGAKGPLRRLFGRKGRGRGIGLEVHIPADEVRQLPFELQIRFGVLPYGYGWVFPDREFVCVGAGIAGSAAPAVQVQRALESLLGSLGIDPSGCSLKAAPIPSLAVHRTLGEGDVYLIGDAAGLCDQVSGEGISHAIESGFMAADAISTAWSRKKLAREAGKGCVGIVRQSAIYRHLLFHPYLREEAMYRLGRDTQFAELYWELISGHVSYHGMFAQLLGPS